MSKKITADELAENLGNNLIDDLLDHWVQELETQLGSRQRGLGNKVLSLFLENGNRIQVERKAVLEELATKRKLPPPIVDRLLESLLAEKILRTTPSGRLELSNNLLALRAHQKVDAENRVLRGMRSTIRDRMSRNQYLDEPYLNYLAASLDQLELTVEELQFIEESRRQIQRTKRRRGLLLTLVFFLVSTLATWGMIQTFRTNQKNQELVAVQSELEDNNRTLKLLNFEMEVAKLQADSLADLALRQADAKEQLAFWANLNADLARREAFFARQSAEIARVANANMRLEKARAEAALESEKVQRQIAATESLEANIARNEAVKAKNEAQEARNRAEQYNRIVVALNAAAKSAEVQDPQLRALVARQAYNFIRSSADTGLVRHPFIFRALIDAVAALNPALRFQQKAHLGTIRDLVFHPDGQRFFSTGSDGKVLEWTIGSWAPLGAPTLQSRELPVQGGAVHHSLCLSANGQKLLVGGMLPLIQTYDLSTRQTTSFKRPNKDLSTIFQLGFLHRGGDLAVLTSDELLRYQDREANWTTLNTGGGRVGAIVEGPQPAAYVVQSQSSRLGRQLNIDLFDGQGVHKVQLNFRQFPTAPLAATRVKINPRGMDTLALGFEDGQIVILELDFHDPQHPTGKYFQLFKQHQTRISDVVFSPSGRFLAVSSFDGTISIWDLRQLNDPTYQPLVLLGNQGWIFALAFSPNEKFLLSGGQNGTIHFWNLQPRVYAETICQELLRLYPGPRYDLLQAEDWQRFFGAETQNQRICH